MSLTRIAWWCLPCLVAACGSSSVNGNPSGDAGRHPSNAGAQGGGGSSGLFDGGVAAGGRRPDPQPSGGRAAGGFIGGDGAFFGGDGGFVGMGGSFIGDGGFIGAGGSFIGNGGVVLGTGGVPGAGGAFAAGGRLVDPACCEAIPFCRAGYDQVSGPGECVKGDICYEATACCSTIWCKAHSGEDAGACAAEGPPGVHYVSADASVCDRRAWECPANTYQYWDTCGCGCSQDSACPESIDCKKTPSDAICTDAAACPYTDRVR